MIECCASTPVEAASMACEQLEQFGEIRGCVIVSDFVLEGGNVRSGLGKT
jgi:hypothetical protein